jgi:hypothetical protein
MKHGYGRVVDVSEYDDDDRFTVRSYLSEIERICAGINSGVFDYEMLRKMMGAPLIRGNHRFRQYIDQQRENQRNVYIEFDEVAKRLRTDAGIRYENIGRIRSS